MGDVRFVKDYVQIGYKIVDTGHDHFRLVIAIYDDRQSDRRDDVVFYDEIYVATSKGNKWKAYFAWDGDAEKIKSLLLEKPVEVLTGHKTLKLLRRAYKEAGLDCSWFSDIDIFRVDDMDEEVISTPDDYFECHL